MADAQEYTASEALNRVLNADENALKVDIDNVTLTTEGSDIAIDVALDKANDSVLIFGNTNKAGSGTSYVPLVDADGHLQVDTLSSALPSGAATAANQATIIGHVDGVETLLTAANVDHAANEALLTTIDADTNAIKVDMAAIEVLLTSANVDHAANEVLLGTIDADTDAIKTDIAALEVLSTAANVDLAAMEVLLTAANVDHAANEVLLTGIDVDTNAIKVDIAALEVLSTAANVDLAEIEVATEATQSALEKMLYGNALVITAVDGGSTQALGATYESLYVGVGGNVVVTMVGTGNFTFNNVASGQLLPIRFTHVINTNTTATNMIALKA
jgi:hypothetical protein|tara:strand:- start:246 stop:1241 length:996 start_codon:yes stop_codon:yes gene_type:complete